MAQKREKEETELKVSESLPLCTPITVPGQLSGSGSSDDSRSSSARSPGSPDLKFAAANARSMPERPDLAAEVPKGGDEEVHKPLKRQRDAANRCSCSGCRRKLGLMGFRCRCGEVFCSEHRYSDRHDCSYDYKAAGREAIARENPVVKAAKILKV